MLTSGMGWTVRTDDRLKNWILGLPDDINAKLIRILDLMVENEPHNVREPYVKSIKGHKKLFEIRAKGKDGIARVFYFTIADKQIVLLHGFIKKSQATPKKEIDTAVARMKEILEAHKEK
jgi:phage-related protein